MNTKYIIMTAILGASLFLVCYTSYNAGYFCGYRECRNDIVQVDCINKDACIKCFENNLQ